MGQRLGIDLAIRTLRVVGSDRAIAAVPVNRYELAAFRVAMASSTSVDRVAPMISSSWAGVVAPAMGP
jgi:hypothetical protein